MAVWYLPTAGHVDDGGAGVREAWKELLGMLSKEQAAWFTDYVRPSCLLPDTSADV